MRCVYCSGTGGTSAGLSKWGSYELAKRGMETADILKNYYGGDIEIITDTPVEGIAACPQRTLQPGSTGNDVKSVQTRLNRISTNYPLIPKINPVNGVFGRDTEDAVKAFQHIFNLAEDGVVGKPTWYKIQYVYNDAKKLSELASAAMTSDNVSKKYHDILKQDDTGPKVALVQYLLSFAAQYMQAINPIQITGNFDTETAAAVRGFRRIMNLANDAVVDEDTYNKLFDVYMGLLNAPDRTIFYSRTRPLPKTPLFPGTENENVAYMKACLNFIAGAYDSIPALTSDGVFDKNTRDAVMIFQELFDLPQVDIVNLDTWDSIGTLYDDLRAGQYVMNGQYPGYVIDERLSAEGGDYERPYY
jgi:peptidoglycan hydrolase-like protein with peptidoglycan-binding domain